MQKFTTTAAVTAVLSVPGGRVQLIAADRSDATVDVRPSNPGRSRDVKAVERTEVDFADGVLRVRTATKNELLGPSGSLEITVQLPAGSRAEVTTSGEVRGVGRLGDVEIEAALGPVKLDEAAAARITVQSGDITVGRLTGDSQLSTQQGDLTVSEAVRGTVELTTQVGDITLAAAPGVSAALDAGTTVGRIHNSLKNADATPGVTFRATTTQGDITARSL